MRVKLADLKPGKNYYFELQGKNDAGELSGWSRKFFLHVDDYTVLPSTPSTPTWVVAGDSFHGEWAPVTTNTLGVTIPIVRYEVKLVADGVTKYLSVVPLTTTGELVTFDLPFEANRALFGTPKPSVTISVSAVDNLDKKSAFSPSVTQSNPVPGDPTSVTATAGINQINLTWNGPLDNDIIGYRIYTSTNTLVGFVNATSFTYPTTTYSSQTLKVATVDKFNQESSRVSSNAVTPGSPFGSDTTPPGTPEDFGGSITTTSDAKNTQAHLYWSPNTEPDLGGYFLRYKRSSESAASWQEIRVTKETTETIINNLIPYVSYDFQLRAVDFSENMSAWSSTLTLPGAENGAPATPTMPSVAGNTLQAQVTIPGTKASGGSPMDADVIYYEVYASTTNPVTISNANMIGTIPVGPAMIATFDIPATGTGTDTSQTWYYRIIAVDSGGLKSPASANASASSGLLANANIGYATITDAKIANLNVNKLVAGTIDTGNISVASSIILGTATSTGVIETYDYTTSGGITGTHIDKNGIIIRTGAIYAPALRIQPLTENLIDPKYADFEYFDYTGAFTTSNVTAVVNTAQAKFNKQALRLTGSGSAGTVWFGSSANATLNWVMSNGQATTYIVSWYAYLASGSSVTMTPKLRYGTSTDFAGAVGKTISTAGSWQRFDTTITVTGSPRDRLGFAFDLSSNSSVLHIDGVQIEEQLTGATTPSTWTPPGFTTIDGGQIRTGSIRSATVGRVWDTTLNGGLGAYKTGTDPEWEINTSGAATFSNVLVKGAIVVGTGTEPTTALATISSFNYAPNSTGWTIRSDGYAEFRRLASDSISGDAIRAGTLAIDKLLGGSLTQEIALASGSSIVATGLMGERVGLADYGFLVTGPQETTVTNKQASSSVATLTTAVAHNFSVGSKIAVKINDPIFDVTEAYVASIPTTTTFTYSITSSSTVASTAITSGIVQGRNSGSDASGPPLINFPSDGSKPSIISGKLTATSVSVSEIFVLSNGGIGNIERGATFNINATIEAPKAAPSYNISYNDVMLKNVPGTNVTGVTTGHNSNLFVSSFTTNSDGSVNSYISEHYQGGDWVQNVFTQTSASSAEKHYYYGVVYGVVGGTGRYYVHRFVIDDSANQYTHAVFVYTTAWASVGSYIIFQTLNSNPIGASRSGWDYTNSRYIFSRRNTDGNPILIHQYAMNASGVPTGASPAETLTLTNGPQGGQIAMVMRGNFDYGSGVDRYVVRTTNYNSNNTLTSQYSVFDNTGATDFVKNWPVANGATTSVGWWNGSRFLEMTSAKIVRTYEGGDSYWSSTAMTDIRWVRYSWYNTASNLSTTLSPALKVIMPKRSRVGVTIAPVPYSATGGTTPDKAKVYMRDGDNDTFPTLTTYIRRAIIDYTSQFGDINPYSPLTTADAVSTNGFAGIAGDPGQITALNSYWRGNGSALFNALIVNAPISLSGSTWTTITTFSNSFTAVGSQPPQWRKDAAGNVAIRGAVNVPSGATSGQVMFNIGSANAPQTYSWYDMVRIGTAAATAGLRVDTNGDVAILWTSRPATAGLETILPTF